MNEIQYNLIKYNITKYNITENNIMWINVDLRILIYNESLIEIRIKNRKITYNFNEKRANFV